MTRTSSSRAPAVRRGSPRTVPEQLDHLVQSHPQQAIVEARRLLEASPNDPELTLSAWAAIGRSLYELGDMYRAPEAMHHALRAGESLQNSERLTSARISAAAIFAESGKLSAALNQLRLAEGGAEVGILGRIQLQRAFILCHAGRLMDALEQADLSEANLRKSGDRLGRLRLFVNRALINLQRGELVLAEADLQRARRLADRLDQAVIAAGVTANLGVLHARAGRIVPALQHFEIASEQYA